MYEKTQLEEDPDYPPRVAINNLSMRRSSESNNKMPRLRMSGLDDKCDMALIICQGIVKVGTFCSASMYYYYRYGLVIWSPK